jgi:hypothetical protein
VVFNINPAGGGGLSAEDLGAVHVWKTTSTEVTTKISTTLEYVEIIRATDALAARQAHYSDSISIDSNGNIVLDNPSTVSVAYNTYTNANVLRGKYWSKDGYPAVWFTPTSSSAAQWVDTDDYSYRDLVVRMQSYRVMTESVETVSTAFSEDANAYPQDDTIDGIRYQYLDTFNDIIAQTARIETGSYIGTGKYGSSNPCRLTFGFAPKYVSIWNRYEAQRHFFAVRGQVHGMSGETMTGTANFYITWGENNISWYSDDDVGQFNSGSTYYYIAIG